MLLKTAGFDSILIDMEHSTFDLDTTSQICISALYAGITPIVRSPTKEPFFVSRILDGGALGVIVPHIKTAQDARDVVAAAKFQPIGHRSATAGLPHLQFRPLPAKIASPALNDATMVIPMIETLEALEVLDEIASVPGVDSLLIGGNDLTAELGIPGQYDEPIFDDAIQRTIRACQKAGISCGLGGLHSRPDLLTKYCLLGANWILAGIDAGLLLAGATATANTMARIEEEVSVANAGAI
jgi:2-keto-3-deoxy-L-rhamnonate aldolase RhmA